MKVAMKTLVMVVIPLGVAGVAYGIAYDGAGSALFPIEWDELFGLVMIESMACGTPVIATRYGAVPEVIDDGVSGVIVDNWRHMESALERADALDAHQLRATVEERFSPRRMVSQYVTAFEATIERWAHRAPPSRQ